ncbi:MFS transporter, AAHS family, 4-hydroxybenzoate transporter [Rhizobiales bacterium GAS188]|nr:MFS transporter, AAHS family, 4-hydroxybenzoate transporter [Rhizobiales bacterium GAS188]
MQTLPPVDVAALIDARPVGWPQIGIIALCGLVVVLDGLDLQGIGLAAPLMAAALHIPPQALGWVFSAALAGLAIGAFVLGPVADRIGRKSVLIGSTLCFGVFSICTALVGDFNQLLICRFLTGLGLGGAMPSFISLTSEYAPKRLRATIVALLWAGFPLGGVIGGLVASRIIPEWGWQSIFWAGGVPPILLAALLWLALPESIGFLVAGGASPHKIAALLARLFPGIDIGPDRQFVLGEERATGVPIGQLFGSGRAIGTTFLWISFFIAFMMLVTNSAWVPSLLRPQGIEVAQAAFAMASFNFGSLIGTSLAGWLVTRFGAPSILPAVFVGAAASFSLIGYAVPSAALVTLLEALFGLFLGCGSSGLIALAALYYPTAIRSTGVGWAMGMGRFGSFLGPLVVGTLVAAHFANTSIFLAIGLPALIAAITSALIRQGRSAAATPSASAVAFER